MDESDIQRKIKTGTDAKSLGTKRTGQETTLRERWRRTMFFQRVDKIPNFEFGYWDETLWEWHKQGLPSDITDEASAYRYFGIESAQATWVDMMGLRPAFDHKVIEETDEYIVYRDGSACTAQINKKGHKSIPHFIDFYLKDRRTWEEYKERLHPSPDRVPSNWPELAAAYNKRDYPLAVGIGSMIGVPRNWIGFENIALMVYDDPVLLEEIVETLCALTCDTLSRVLPDVEFDFGSGWEDICFNSGPIVGYRFMRDVVMPRYQRITALLRKHGCHVAWTDCDGNIMPILDVFMEGGLNCQFPVEVNAGSDPILMRRKYPGILIQGGFCKLKLVESKEATLAEMKRILPLVREGGFLPGLDHRVPVNVPLETYKYYLKLKRDMLGVGGTPMYDESGLSGRGAGSATTKPSWPWVRLPGSSTCVSMRSPFVTAWHVSRIMPKGAGIARAKCVNMEGETEWTPFDQGTFVNLHEHLFDDKDGLVYLANRFTVAERGEWDILLGHDGGARVFVDGKCVLTEPERQNPAKPARSRARVKLAKGQHEVVIAFDLAGGLGWGIFFNWEKPDGKREPQAEPVFPKPAAM